MPANPAICPWKFEGSPRISAPVAALNATVSALGTEPPKLKVPPAAIVNAPVPAIVTSLSIVSVPATSTAPLSAEVFESVSLVFSSVAELPASMLIWAWAAGFDDRAARDRGVVERHLHVLDLQAVKPTFIGQVGRYDGAGGVDKGERTGVVDRQRAVIAGECDVVQRHVAQRQRRPLAASNVVPVTVSLLSVSI